MSSTTTINFTDNRRNWNFKQKKNQKNKTREQQWWVTKKKRQLSHSLAESPFLQKQYFQMTSKDFIWTDLWSKTETVACALKLWSTETHGEGELLILLLLCVLLAPLPSSVFWSYSQLPKATSQVQAHLLLNLCFGHWGIHCYSVQPLTCPTHILILTTMVQPCFIRKSIIYQMKPWLVRYCQVAFINP